MNKELLKNIGQNMKYSHDNDWQIYLHRYGEVSFHNFYPYIQGIS